MSSFSFKFALISTLLIVEVIPIKLSLQEGEELQHNNVEESELNNCITTKRGVDIGVCFGKELLNKLNKYDESESFSLASSVSLVRDDKTPRDLGSFLDKDPMDFR